MKSEELRMQDEGKDYGTQELLMSCRLDDLALLIAGLLLTDRL